MGDAQDQLRPPTIPGIPESGGWQQQRTAWATVVNRYGLDPDRYAEFDYLCFLDLTDKFVDNYAKFHLGIDKPIFHGRLAAHYDFWVSLNSPQWLLDLIKNGVKIPWVCQPPRMFLPNSQSVIKPEHVQWVRDTLHEFLDFGFVSIVHDPPYCEIGRAHV